MKRECGECTLCCRLVPVNDSGITINGIDSTRALHKAAGQRCVHQRRTGCSIYLRRPVSCRAWSCMWLQGAAMRRPDRSHYVIDMLPDFVTTTDETGHQEKVPVAQIWIDENYPDAHLDTDLRAWLEHRSIAGLVRYGNTRGLVLFPPSVTGSGWVTIGTEWMQGEPEHTAAEINEVLEAANDK